MTPRRRATPPHGGEPALDLFAAAVEPITPPPPPPPVLVEPRPAPTRSRPSRSKRTALALAPFAVESVPGATPASAVSVSTLTATTRELLEGAFVPLWVHGEVSDFKSHRNGHWYFCLRDHEAQIRCVVWSRDRRRIPAAPDDGMRVAAFGQVTVYAARGDLQLVVSAMEAQGDGLWRKALEETRARLLRDGLLDPARKRPLPRYPRRIGVVTSPDGAALHDIVSVARRRNPCVEIVLAPAAVQGDGAPAALCGALDRLFRWGGADVVIIGRGGGAREDLWAFNDEMVARMVAAAPVPTISAVGHEIDVTICDLAADLRAATPSAAAEAAVPVRDDIAAELHAVRAALCAAMDDRLGRAREQLRGVAKAAARVAASSIERRRTRVDALAGRLHALSPLATLARGYAVVRRPDGVTLTRVAALSAGDDIDVLMSDGIARASVRSVDSRLLTRATSSGDQ